MTFEDRLDALGRLDLAGLLDPYRNHIRRIRLAGDTADADRQVSWWEEAFGDDRLRLAFHIEVLRDRPVFVDKVQPFGLAALSLRPAFDRLSDAISVGSLARFGRWRFLAHLYVARIDRLISAALDLEEASRLLSEYVAAFESVDTGRYRVLDANLSFRDKRLAEPVVGAARLRACAERSLDILRLVRKFDSMRTVSIRRRDELLAALAAQSADERAGAARGGASTVAGEVIVLEEVLRQIDAASALEAAMEHGVRLKHDLRREFGFSVRTREATILRDIISSLRMSATTEAGHSAVKDPERPH
jgi:hypothetical protein